MLAGRARRTGGYAVAATLVTSTHVWNAWVRAARYWGGGAVTAAEVEEIVDLIVSREETLSLPG
jgi:hypothetical protein